MNSTQAIKGSQTHKSSQQTESVNQKHSILFFLEGTMVLCFLLIVVAFIVPSNPFAMNIIISAIIVAGSCAIGILAFANKKIGVERGLFKLPTVAQRTY